MKHSNTTIGEIVAEDYRTASIFENRGIDFCCGSKLTLTAACREKGLDPALLLQEIHAVREYSIELSRDYSSWELSFLADYIVNVHHAYLNRNTALLAGYTKKIADVHGSRHPESLEITTIFEKIMVDLIAHLQQELEKLML